MKSGIRITVVETGLHQCASGGSKWEGEMGYSRAVRCGPSISVTGTLGVKPDGTYPPSVEEQTRRSLEVIRASIEALGGRMENVVRTRIFMRDIARWPEVARVHGEVFRTIRPAISVVQVGALIEKGALVQIEADAYVPELMTM